MKNPRFFERELVTYLIIITVICFFALTDGYTGAGGVRLAFAEETTDSMNFSVSYKNSYYPNSSKTNISSSIIPNKTGRSGTPRSYDEPNLTPYNPNGWSDKIVVSNTTGATEYSAIDSVIYTTDDVYVNWAVTNDGMVSVYTPFSTTIYVDGVEIITWPTYLLEVYYFTAVLNIWIDHLSAGTHTITIQTDSTWNVSESNEFDNEYTKTITVEPDPSEEEPDDLYHKVIIKTPQTEEEIANSPVVFKDNNFTLSFPHYDPDVDIYIAIHNSGSNQLLFVDSNKALTTNISPYATSTNGYISTAFSVEDDLSQYSSLYGFSGQSSIYWLIAPSNGGDIMQSISDERYEFGGYAVEYNSESTIATYQRTSTVDGTEVVLHAVAPTSLGLSSEALYYNLITELQHQIIQAGKTYSESEYLIREYFGIYAYETIAQIPDTSIPVLTTGIPSLADILDKNQNDLLPDILNDIINGAEQGYGLRSNLVEPLTVTAVNTETLMGEPLELSINLSGTLSSLYRLEWEQSEAWDLLDAGASTTSITFNVPAEQYLSVSMYRNSDNKLVLQSGINIKVYQTQTINAQAAADAPGYVDIGDGIRVTQSMADAMASSDSTIYKTEGSSELVRADVPPLNAGDEIRYSYNPIYIRDPITLQMEYFDGVDLVLLTPQSVDYEKHEIIFIVPEANLSNRSGLKTTTQRAQSVGSKHFITVKALVNKPTAKDIYSLLDGRRSLLERIAGTFIIDKSSINNTTNTNVMNYLAVKELVDFIYSDLGKAKLQYVLEQNENGGYLYGEFVSLLNQIIAQECLQDLQKTASTGEPTWNQAILDYFSYYTLECYSCFNTYDVQCNYVEECNKKWWNFMDPVRRMHDGLSAWIGRPELTASQETSLRAFKAIVSLAGGITTSGSGVIENVGDATNTWGGAYLSSSTNATNLTGYIWGAAFDVPKALAAAKSVKGVAMFLPGLGVLGGAAVNLVGNTLVSLYEDSTNTSNLRATAPIMLAIRLNIDLFDPTESMPVGLFMAKFLRNEYFQNVYDDFFAINDGKLFDTDEHFPKEYDPTGRLENLLIWKTNKPTTKEQIAAKKWMKAAFGATKEVEEFQAVTDIARLRLLLILLRTKYVSDWAVKEVVHFDDGAFDNGKGTAYNGSLLIPSLTLDNYHSYTRIKSKYQYKSLIDSFYDSSKSKRTGLATSRSTSTSNLAITQYPSFSSASDLFSKMGFNMREEIFNLIQSGKLSIDNVTVRIGGYPVTPDTDNTLLLGTPTVKVYRSGSVAASSFTQTNGFAKLPLSTLLPELTNTEWNNKLLAFEVAITVSQNGKNSVLSDRFIYATVADTKYSKPIESEKGDITGRLLDEQGNPVADTLIRLNPFGLTTRTDANGNYLFSGIVKGKYTVEILSERVDVAVTVDSNTVPDATVTPKPQDEEEPSSDTFTNSLGMTFKLIPAGTFMMGSPEDEPGRYYWEVSPHQVTLTQPYYMQTTEVTQGQWKAVMGSNPSYFQNCGDDCPVENVSWDDVQTFIAKLNQRAATQRGSLRLPTDSAIPPIKYSLPTEAQWEYAARAGSTTAFANGGITELSCGYDANLDKMGWYCGNSDVTYQGCYDTSPFGGSKCSGTHPVAQKSSNAWGLYDMQGNVWEWCQDWGAYYYNSNSLVDPNGSPPDTKTFRGGSWEDYAFNCRLGINTATTPLQKRKALGFRLVIGSLFIDGGFNEEF